ncbi:hypothetical protein QP568_05080 [Propionimicrobium lymphophilum]|uniref:hypothetical protein n=1 Tax=Propionimicrobium lymphophilum TaxID=33012 RepID=UPI00254C17C3|nr:hypothetical protein [Propionimicrobium lymphophilum]MDK7710727.1 hypothetical protein [Propionimicrobium lymphophilum]MDK7733665.1 hypothetical protein [Propionimicrobium lymphophilum]
MNNSPALATMSIGSIVTGVAMVAARLRVPDNTIGQTAFTLLFAVVFVVLIHALVVGARNNKLDAYGFGPRVSNMIVIGCMIVAIVMWALFAFMVLLMIQTDASAIFNALSVAGLATCATGATWLLRGMVNKR